MADKYISIISDFNSNLGNGHFQRMLNLLYYLNRDGDFNAYLINSRQNLDMTDFPTEYILSDIHPDSDLVIRDLRDSSIEDIKSLREISDVMVIDDAGPGRDEADYVVDLLPNLINISEPEFYRPEFFLFGYNFTRSINEIKEDVISKSIDISFYTGSGKHNNMLDIIERISEGHNVAVLSGGRPFSIFNGKKELIQDLSISELLLSSKVFLSHIGITLYEAEIAGCSLITVNPTEYHNKITELAKNEFSILNLGEDKNLDINGACNIIINSIRDYNAESVQIGSISDQIELKLSHFTDYIKTII